MLREIGLLINPILLGVLVLCCIFITGFTAHFQSLAVGKGYGSQVPFSYTITVTIFTIVGALIEGLSLFLEVIKSPVAKDIRRVIAVGEPYVEVVLGIFWLAVLIVVGQRQKMGLVGGCLDHDVFGYVPNSGVCNEWKACLFFVVVACFSLAAWVGINHATKSRDLCVPFLQQYIQQRAQQKAARQAAAAPAPPPSNPAPPISFSVPFLQQYRQRRAQQRAARQAAAAPAPPQSPAPPASLPPSTIAHPPAAGPMKELSESTMASKLPGTRESSAWAPSLAHHQDSRGASSASDFGVLTPPASPPPSTLPPWIRGSRAEGSDTATISSILTPPPMHADAASPPAGGPNNAPV